MANAIPRNTCDLREQVAKRSNMNLYAIRDEKAAYFHTPFACKSQQDAVRNCINAVNDPQSNLNRFSDDYSLYTLGHFNELDGVITPLKSGPERITTLSVLKNQEAIKK